MKKIHRLPALLTLALMAASFGVPLRASEPTPAPAPASAPNEAEMMAEMMELAKPGEHHQQLAALAGTWTYTMKFASAPGAALAEAGHGTAVRKAIMDGRYFTTDVKGKMLMPGPDGKMADLDFKGMSIDAYDNVKQKFVASWIDSLGTSIVLSEGSYDPATKTFTYDFEMEPMPGMKTKARQVVKILDADHHQMEWYENHGGQEVKTMEIDYVRQK